jgi:glycosyltransferase involved in cell wall biosynthesis
MGGLSAVIITYNEERNIERCIRSLQAVADEILVVDSFSTDRTESICKNLGVKFLQRKFTGYGDQKKYATQQALFDNVLSLDADEELCEELRISILSEKPNLNGSSYSFNRRNVYCGKPIRFCGWYPDTQIRLFDRRIISWSERMVHESVELSNRNDRPIHLKGDLIHYTCTTIAEHQSKELKYSELNAKILIESNKKVTFILPYLKGLFRFIKVYILKLGLFDGYYGWVISITLAKSSFRKYYLVRKQK